MDNEADQLRMNLARFLAPDYLNDRLRVANICDTELDRSGKLLGMVRDEAKRLLRKRNDMNDF